DQSGDYVAAVAGTGSPEREAAEALYERFYANIYRYALTQVRSPQDAEDATQNTFLRAYAALQRVVVPENEAACLFKIAHNVCLSSKLAWLRRRRVETPRDLDDLEVAPRAAELQRDELFGLDDALAAMPPRLREAFLLREWQGLSYAEIAERLDTSHSAVETLIFRARRMLAAQLESPLQPARQALGAGQLLALLRGLLGGGSLAVKAAAVAAVVAAATGVTVAVEQPSHRPAPVVHHPAVAPAVQTHTQAPVTRAAAHTTSAKQKSSPATTSHVTATQPAAPAAVQPQPGAPAPPQSAAPAPSAPATGTA